jgi:hypothetical protein
VKLDKSRYAYHAIIKLSELPSSPAHAAFPGLTEIGVNSRHFGSYGECVNSAKVLMEDIVKNVNTEHEQLTLSAEVNPTYTGIETRSRDWEPAEVSRFWIFDATQTGAQSIHAVGQARIFALSKAPPALPMS